MTWYNSNGTVSSDQGGPTGASAVQGTQRGMGGSSAIVGGTDDALSARRVAETFMKASDQPEPQDDSITGQVLRLARQGAIPEEGVTKSQTPIEHLEPLVKGPRTLDDQKVRLHQAYAEKYRGTPAEQIHKSLAALYYTGHDDAAEKLKALKKAEMYPDVNVEDEDHACKSCGVMHKGDCSQMNKAEDEDEEGDEDDSPEDDDAAPEADEGEGEGDEGDEAEKAMGGLPAPGAKKLPKPEKDPEEKRIEKEQAMAKSLGWADELMGSPQYLDALKLQKKHMDEKAKIAKEREALRAARKAAQKTDDGMSKIYAKEDALWDAFDVEKAKIMAANMDWRIKQEEQRQAMKSLDAFLDEETEQLQKSESPEDILEDLVKAGGHKYIKRTGGPGNYVYHYADGSTSAGGGSSSGQTQPSKMVSEIDSGKQLSNHQHVQKVKGQFAIKLPTWAKNQLPEGLQKQSYSVAALTASEKKQILAVLDKGPPKAEAKQESNPQGDMVKKKLPSNQKKALMRAAKTGIVPGGIDSTPTTFYTLKEAGLIETGMGGTASITDKGKEALSSGSYEVREFPNAVHSDKKEHGAYHIEHHGAGAHALYFKEKGKKKSEIIGMFSGVDSAKMGIEHHTKTGHSKKSSIGPEINPNAKWLKKSEENVMAGFEAMDTFLEKAQDMPSGDPKKTMDSGVEVSREEDGGKLAGVGMTSGASSPSGDGNPSAPAPSKDKLSEDDAEDEQQMKPHKKPIEKSFAELLEQAPDGGELARAQLISQLRKAQPDIVLDYNGKGEALQKSEQVEKSEDGPKAWAQRGGSILYTDASDRQVDSFLEKGGQYQLPTANIQGSIHKTHECGHCGTLTKSMYSTCDGCGRDSTFVGEQQFMTMDEQVVKSLIDPDEVAPDILID